MTADDMRALIERAADALDPFARIWRLNACLEPDDAAPVARYIAGEWPKMAAVKEANEVLAALRARLAAMEAPDA